MQRRPLVIVIDDDPAALRSVDVLLLAFDFEVRSFSSAEDFLAADVSLEQACLLSDVRLPGMSGVELHHTLRSQGIELPTILISGYADSDMATKALESGVDAVLEKPIDPNTLVERITTAIQIHKQK